MCLDDSLLSCKETEEFFQADCRDVVSSKMQFLTTEVDTISLESLFYFNRGVSCALDRKYQWNCGHLPNRNPNIVVRGTNNVTGILIINCHFCFVNRRNRRCILSKANLSNVSRSHNNLRTFLSFDLCSLFKRFVWNYKKVVTQHKKCIVLSYFVCLSSHSPHAPLTHRWETTRKIHLAISRNEQEKFL